MVYAVSGNECRKIDVALIGRSIRLVMSRLRLILEYVLCSFWGMCYAHFRVCVMLILGYMLCSFCGMCYAHL